MYRSTTRAYLTKKSKWLPKIYSWVTEHGGGSIVPLSVELEERLAQAAEPAGADEEQRRALVSDEIWGSEGGHSGESCWQVRGIPDRDSAPFVVPSEAGVWHIRQLPSWRKHCARASRAHCASKSLAFHALSHSVPLEPPSQRGSEE
jgi:hypothetical protein